MVDRIVQNLRAQEEQRHDGDDGDERQDERVLGQALAFLVASQQEVDHWMVLRLSGRVRSRGRRVRWMIALGTRGPGPADGTAPPRTAWWGDQQVVFASPVIGIM